MLMSYRKGHSQIYFVVVFVNEMNTIPSSIEVITMHRLLPYGYTCMHQFVNYDSKQTAWSAKQKQTEKGGHSHKQFRAKDVSHGHHQKMVFSLLQEIQELIW